MTGAIQEGCRLRAITPVDLPRTAGIDRVPFRRRCEQLFGEKGDFNASALDAFVEIVIAFIGGKQTGARQTSNSLIDQRTGVIIVLDRSTQFVDPHITAVSRDGKREILVPALNSGNLAEGFIVETEIPPGRKTHDSVFAMKRRPLPEAAKTRFLQPLSGVETRRFCRELSLLLSTV